MNWENEALEFIKAMAAAYFSRRNMEAIGSCLDENIALIGTGRDEISNNLDEAIVALSKDADEYGGIFNITNINLNHLPVLNSSVIVYGNIDACPENEELSDENVRFTAVVTNTDAGIRLLHLHFSHGDILQEEGHFFVSKLAGADNQFLRMELSSRTNQLETLIKNIPGGVHQCLNDEHLTLISMSDGFLDMFGYTSEEISKLFKYQYINLIYPEDRAMVMAKISQQLKSCQNIELEYRVMQKNGSPLWILHKGRLINTADGTTCFYCLIVDVHARKEQEELLRLSLERHQVIMNQATDIIFEWDIVNDTLDFSSNWRKKFGYDAISSSISNEIPLSKNIHPEDLLIFVKLMKDTAAGAPYSEAEFRIGDYTNRYIWCRIRATTQYNTQGRPIKAIGVIADIDTEKRQKQKLLELSQLDPLTGLYNKGAINNMVEQIMQYSVAIGFHALFIIDIDFFKQVNDTYGHLSGDSVLSDVAATLKGHIRSSDLAGRIGGDEFLLYFPQVADEAAALQKGELLLKAFQSISPETGAPPISCSIGMAVFPRGSISYEELYKNADIALYYRKSIGRGGVTLYDEAMKLDGSRSITRTAVDSEVDENSIDNKMANYTFKTLYRATDIGATIHRLLEIIGKSFNVSRAYVFENTPDNLHCSNTFEWCKEGILPQIKTLQNLSYEDDLDNCQNNYDSKGIYYCADVRGTTENQRAVLEPQGIRSMLHCAIMDEGKFAGYIGFDECTNYRAWSSHQIASFKLTADVLSTFIIKLRQRKMLEKLNAFGLQK